MLIITGSTLEKWVGAVVLVGLIIEAVVLIYMLGG